MSVAPITAWIRRNASWSNSRQSWQERISLAIVIVVAVGLVYGHALFSPLQAVILWSLVVLVAAISLRRGWLKLFGPVLFFDMLCLARRSRYFWLRMGYAFVLLMFLFMTWWGLQQNAMEPVKKYALLAESFFGQFMWIQLLTVSILTPAYVASSIAEEKDRKTLEFMLATDLRNREIVLSKLFSRLANLTLFILTGLPILSILQFLGGVDPNLVLGGFLATFMTMLGVGGYSILCSVWFKKPRDAVAVAYLGPLTYVALGLVAFAFRAAGGALFTVPLGYGGMGPTLGDLVDFYNSGNLVVALIQLMQSISRNTMQADLPGILWHYSLFHTLVGLGCIVWAVVRLRAIALVQAHGTTRQAGIRHRFRPAVGELPMLWKEVHIEGNVRLNWAARTFIALLVLTTLGIGAWIILEGIFDGSFFRSQESFSWQMNAWVRGAGTVVACLMILSVAVRASTAISSERDRDTLDSLLTTPLDSDAILWSKFLGCLASTRGAFLWLGIIWFTGLATGGVQVWALPIVFVCVVVYCSAFTILGLWFSLVSRSSMRATLWTVLCTIGISVGHWLPLFCCAIGLIFQGPHEFFETLMKVQTGLTPPIVLGLLPFQGQELVRESREFKEIVGFSLFGVLLYVLGCFFFWVLFLSPRFRQMTHREEFLYPQTTSRQDVLRYERAMPLEEPTPLAQLVDDEPPSSPAETK